MAKSLMKNSFYKFLLTFFNIIIPLIIGPYTYRVLGPTIMGRYNYCYTIYTYFMIFANFGVYSYGIRELSKYKNNKTKLRQSFTNLLLISTGSNIIVFIVFIIFIKYRFDTTNKYYILSLLSYMMLTNIIYVEWALESIENYKFITFKTILIRVFYVILLVTLIKSEKDINRYVYILIGTSFLNYAISFGHIVKSIGLDFKNIIISKHIKPMIIVIIISNANIFYTQLDKLALGTFISEKSVSYYTLSQSIAAMVFTTLISFIMVAIPRFSNLISENKKTEYLEILKTMTDTFLMFLIPATIGIFVLSKEIVLIYGGSQYLNSQKVLQIFIVYMFFNGIEYILTNHILYVNSKEQITIVFIFGCGLLNLLLKYLLIVSNNLNNITAISTTIIAEIILTLIEIIYINKSLKIKFSLISKHTIRYLLLSLIIIPIGILCKMLFKQMIIYLGMVILIFMIIYYISLKIVKDATLLYLEKKIVALVK